MLAMLIFVLLLLLTSAQIAPSVDWKNEHNVSGHDKLLLCFNQSNCISPKLQFQRQIRIYMQSKVSFNCCIRFYYLIREGLLLHPNVVLVHRSEMDSADFFIFLARSRPLSHTEFSNISTMNMQSKLLVLDESDSSSHIELPWSSELLKSKFGTSKQWYFMYFKRSYVTRKDGIFVNFPFLLHPDIYPMSYSLIEQYLPFNFTFTRNISILCTLRSHNPYIIDLYMYIFANIYRTNSYTISIALQSTPHHDLT